MSCKHWNNDWIAHCYGELDAEGERELSRHLERCGSCRATLDQLDASRHLLRAGSPELPDAPRVVVLQPARGSHPAWAFAGGVAAALLLLLTGVLAAPGLGIGATPDNSETPIADTVSQAEFRLAIEATERRFEEQLAELRSVRDGVTNEELLRASVNRDQLIETLVEFEDRVALRRADDRNFLMHEITAAEMRTDYRIDDTRQALQFVALASNPRLSEQ